MTPSQPLAAVIFDVDGTLADTERDGHRPAFNAAFARHGVEITWTPEEYGHLLRITGGRRRITYELRRRGFGAQSEELAAAIHRTKTDLFTEHVRTGRPTPRPGVPALIGDLDEAGIAIAVATTGRRAWVEPLLRAILGDGVARCVVTGDDVTHLKPDPEVYLRALDELGLRPQDALAVEDSAVGLQAARAAGLATVVITNGYTAAQDFTGAAWVRPGFDSPQLLAEHCRAIHRDWCSKAWQPRARQGSMG